MLIACPECGRQVSNCAPVCPDCGYPIAVMVEPHYDGNALRPVQTIEKTSKRLKGQLPLAALVMLFSLGALVTFDVEAEPWAYAVAVCGVAAGAFWAIAVKVSIWWNHG